MTLVDWDLVVHVGVDNEAAGMFGWMMHTWDD